MSSISCLSSSPLSRIPCFLTSFTRRRSTAGRRIHGSHSTSARRFAPSLPLFLKLCRSRPNHFCDEMRRDWLKLPIKLRLKTPGCCPVPQDANGTGLEGLIWQNAELSMVWSDTCVPCRTNPYHVAMFRLPTETVACAGPNVVPSPRLRVPLTCILNSASMFPLDAGGKPRNTLQV